MPTHLTDEQLRAFAGRRLGAGELLAADAHLAECAACRSRAPRAGSGPLLSDHERTEHLPEGAASRLVDGELDEVERELAESHLEGCADCAAEVAAVGQARDELQPVRVFAPARSAATLPRRAPAVWLASAAALAAVLVGSWWLLQQSPPRPQVATAEPSPVDDLQGVAPDLRPRIVALRQTGRLDVVVPDDLRPAAGTLMGGPAGRERFGVVSPVATVVTETAPVLRWSALPGDTTYEVLVVDERLAIVARSPRLTTTSWTTPPLARGMLYTWQVVATRAGERVLAPEPPAPEARFRTLDDAVVARLATLPAGSHLERAVLLASAGAGEAAEEELRKAGPAPYRPSPTSTNPAQ